MSNPEAKAAAPAKAAAKPKASKPKPKAKGKPNKPKKTGKALSKAKGKAKAKSNVKGTNNNTNKAKRGKQQKEKKRLPMRHFHYKLSAKPSRKIGHGGVLKRSVALGRLIKWPRYIRLQRQRKILLQRLVIPPALNMFNRACPREFAAQLVSFCKTYAPETADQKKQRLLALAKLQADGKPIPSEKPFVLKSGFNTVTSFIEHGRAKFVMIAHDVDPIELVLWMPALCVKKDVPFVIFKSKARLGALVGKKKVCAVCITDVKPGDKKRFTSLCNQANAMFNSKFNDLKKKWGKRVLGYKTRMKIEKRKRVRQAEKERRRAAQTA